MKGFLLEPSKEVKYRREILVVNSSYQDSNECDGACQLVLKNSFLNQNEYMF